MPKFVIQKHTRHGDTHWDLMLEFHDADKLRTWRIDAPPQDWIVGPMTAEEIANHDKKFLTYQGAVNNGTGQVQLADTGELKIISEKDNRIEFTLTGKILNGNFALTKNQDNHWQLIFYLAP